MHSWRQRGRACAEDEDKIKNTQEKSLESREDSRFTGVVVGDETGKIKRKIERVEEDGILLVVPARINGKLFTALIDSGATRCFVTPECSTIAGLSCVPHDTFLELGNGARALSRGMVQGAPITLAGVTTRLDLTVSSLLHEVDIVLGINWLKTVNPIIDWCSGRVYLPGAIHTALLEGTWLSADHAIGTVKLLSTSVGLESIKDESVRDSIAILRTPKFWQAVNSRSNFSMGDVQQNIDGKVDCKNSSKLFIRQDDNFGHLYVKKIRNKAAIPRRGTEDAAGYDIVSAEETIVPSKGKTVVKTGISIAVPDGCYGRLAPRSGLAVKKHIDAGAGVIDADYRGEIGVVLFNHSEEDFQIKQGDRIAQLILEKIETPPVKETADLPSTVRGKEGFGSTGINDEKEEQKNSSSRISILQRVQGKPKLKRTDTYRMQREFVSIKKMQKLMKQKEQVFLCIIKAEQPSTERRRRARGGSKSTGLGNIVAQNSHGITQRTKREHSKAVGPKKDFKTVEERTKAIIDSVAKEHQTKLQTNLQNIAMCSRTSCLRASSKNGRFLLLLKSLHCTKYKRGAF